MSKLVPNRLPKGTANGRGLRSVLGSQTGSLTGSLMGSLMGSLNAPKPAPKILHKHKLTNLYLITRFSNVLFPTLLSIPIPNRSISNARTSDVGVGK